jgi:nitroreductase
MPKLNLTADQVLTTTRAVRKRLDLERPLNMEEVRECLEIALQAPSGSNAQGWHFVLVTQREKIEKIAEYYRRAFADYEAGPGQPTKVLGDRPEMAHTQEKVLGSAQYLAENLHRVPAMLIPCSQGRADSPGLSQSMLAGMFGSVLPATWSFMLAARERGIGTCWTMLHLEYEQQVAELLGIPDDHMQVAMTPLAYTLGTDFRPARRLALDDVLHVDSW